jgi:glycosyltransferase involved in cell wall biosynthesis
MRILLIAPVPPPITGQSLATKVFLDDLSRTHEVEVVNLTKDSHKDGEVSLKRIREVAKILKDTWRLRKDADVIYLTISESFAGNVKDVFIYLIFLKRLSRMYIHLHGGSLGSLLFDRHKLVSYLNKLFIRRLAGVIVSGDSHLNIFDKMIPQSKIHIVPNFASNYLFVSEKEISDKFSNTQPLRILYISSLQKKKGYNELVDAYLKLTDKSKSSIRIDFAGRFESDSHKEAFLKKIGGAGQLHFHGVIDDAQKKLLFSKAHVFCLPTTFLEGQPISILEAYASGCVVLTTCQPGILDVFTDGVNGFGLPDGSPDTIRLALEQILESRDDLLKVAIVNSQTASQKYRTSSFNARLRAIIETSGIPLTQC